MAEKAKVIDVPAPTIQQLKLKLHRDSPPGAALLDTLAANITGSLIDDKAIPCIDCDGTLADYTDDGYSGFCHSCLIDQTAIRYYAFYQHKLNAALPAKEQSRAITDNWLAQPDDWTEATREAISDHIAEPEEKTEIPKKDAGKAKALAELREKIALRLKHEYLVFDDATKDDKPQLFRTPDGIRWLKDRDNQLELVIRQEWQKLTDYPLATITLGEIKKVVMAAATPPADSVLNLSRADRHENIDLDNCQKIDIPCAFDNLVIVKDSQNNLVLKPRRLNMLIRNAVPRKLVKKSEAPPTPLFDSFLWKYCIDATDGDEEDARVMQQGIITTMAVALVNVKFDKMAIFTGEGGTGKSVMLNIMAGLVDSDTNMWELKLNKFDRPFETANLRLRKLITIADMPPRPAGNSAAMVKYNEQTHLLKAIVAGDAINAEKKNIQETPPIVVKGLIVASTNNMPKFMATGEKQGSWRRRFLIFGAPKEMIPEAEQNTGLTDEILTNEIDGVLWKALDAVFDAWNPAKSKIEITLSQLSQSLIKEATYEELSDFVAQYQPDGDAKVWYSDIKRHWAEHTGANEGDSQKLPPKVLNALVETHQAKRLPPAYPPAGGAKDRSLAGISRTSESLATEIGDLDAQTAEMTLMT